MRILKDTGLLIVMIIALLVGALGLISSKKFSDNLNNCDPEDK